jgi:choline dehydrogenase
LRVETEAQTTRILFEGKRAVGVEYVQGGETKVARANAEVILAAGAVASPQLLEVSGIGAGKVLQGLGVPVLHELPGVGENLQDHYMIGCQWPVKAEYKTVNELSHGFQLAREIVKYAVAKKGLLTYSVAHIVAFTRTRPELEHPDVQFH